MEKDQNTISINNLHYFNAHTRSDQDVVDTFIARKAILNEFEDSLEAEAPNSIPQHYMIIGSRGMGKSTLLRRLEITLKSEKFRKKFIPILFPEEQYNIDRLSKFWLNSLDALADTYEAENNHKQADYLDEFIDAMSQIKEEDQLSAMAFEALQECCAKDHRRPVFLIDNIDILFEGITSDEQFKLRKIITTNSAPIFIAASTHNPSESQNYDAAFYDAFDNIYLDRLSAQEMRELLLILADKTGHEKVFGDIYEKTGQLDALHSLTGGNPRVAVFMFQLIANGLSDKIFENLNSLLDIITPLYKSNFEQLSKQAQVIVDALSLNWDPCDLDTLSQITKLENNQLSSQIERLVKQGWVERSSRFSVEKNKLLVKIKNYSIRERFFNIWYIMRRASRRQRGDLKSLTCFLETFYTPQHLDMEKKRIISIIEENPSSEKIAYGLALSRTNIKDKHSELEDQIFRIILEYTKGDFKKISKLLNPDFIPNDIYTDYMRKEIGRWIKRVDTLVKQKEFQKAIEFLYSILEKQPNDYFVWSRLGNVYYDSDDFENAIAAFKKSIELNPQNPSVNLYLGIAYEDSGDLKAAEDAIKRAVELDPDSSYPTHRLGDIYYLTRRLDEAAQLYSKNLLPERRYVSSIIKLITIKMIKKEYSEAYQLIQDEEQYTADSRLHYLKGLCEDSFKNDEAARIEFEKAIEMDKDFSYYYYYYAKTLVKLGLFQQADQNFRKALELDMDAKWALDFARFLFENANRHQDAIKAAKMANAIESSSEGFILLGEIYNTMSEYKKSETAFKSAIKLDQSNSTSWAYLGLLQHFASHNYKQAEKSYLTCLKYSPNRVQITYFLANLYHYELNKPHHALEYYEKTIAMESNHHNAILNRIYILRDKLGKIEDARMLFTSYHDLLINHPVQYAIQLALFDLYKENIGNAKLNWTKALSLFDSSDDDEMSLVNIGMAVSDKLGFGDRLLEIFEETGSKDRLRPLYEGLQTLVVDNIEYLQNVAAELRGPALKFYLQMLDYTSTMKNSKSHNS